ncbi:MAG: DoxX family membrane protein [bacterium TMED46]|nr:MAG: DoxX family membrane protein [bacterium TMED46]|tara:strand:- start:49121 stop:49630 length:510 start_codon:yes stop_codon:yes gene_type:complete
MKKSNPVIFIILFIQTIIYGQGPSVAERYGDRIELLGIPFKDPLVLCQILIAIFISIAFMQSGLDKILDRKGNLEFFKAHFANTFLKNFTTLLLSILTILELIGALMLIYGIYFAFAYRTTLWIFYGFVVLALTLTFLFAGQRISKDYLGAADLVPYFILIILGIMSMY